MKMTKLLGAVLGVVMVATLFVGAGAASSDVDLGTVYEYVLYDNIGGKVDLTALDNRTWDSSDGKGSITFVPDPSNPNVYYVPFGSEGKYYKFGKNSDKKYIIHVTYPTLQVSGAIYNKDGTATASLIDNTIGTDDYAYFNEEDLILPDTKVKAKLSFTNPADTLTSTSALGQKDKEGLHKDQYPMKSVDLGKWKVRTIFYQGTTGEVKTISTVAPPYFYGDTYSFNVISSDTSKKISCNVENVTQGGYATIKLNVPYGNWNVSVNSPEGFIPDGQPNVDYEAPGLRENEKQYAVVHVGNSGMQTFVVQANSTDDLKVALYKQGSDKEKLKEITIKVFAGSITAELEKSTVYIGDEFDIEGTNDLNGNVYFFIKGTNYPLQYIKDTNGEPLVGAGKEWTATVDTSMIDSYGKSPDAGTYTIYVAKLVGDNPSIIIDTDMFDKEQWVSAYTAISVPFIQPFIKASAADVVVQGDKLEISGSAEGKPQSVRLYVFGTNYFNGYDIPVLDDGTFTWSKKILAPDTGSIDPGSWQMATGQYFAVVQHPMYDKKFNIAPLDSKVWPHLITDSANFSMGADIVLFKNTKNLQAEGEVLFNTASRQSANAAQALIDAMSSQDIDDMQSHFSFVVAGPTSYVNAIPSKITKGQTLTISGTTTGHKNDVVSVELLSTAFAAVPKETVGSASFSTLTTRIGDNGVWSVSFDTSSLNADEYTVSIAVGQLDATTAKVQIIDGPVPTTTPTSGPQPTSSGQPTVAPTSQPTTTPQTPGFGALAALVGLGAVAVLLLRRE